MVVNELGDHLLAAAALPRDEDGGIGRRDLPSQLDRPAERWRGAEQGELVRLDLRPIERFLLLARLAGDQQGVHRAADQHLEVRG